MIAGRSESLRTGSLPARHGSARTADSVPISSMSSCRLNWSTTNT